jgi:hypothetical protein
VQALFQTLVEVHTLEGAGGRLFLESVAADLLALPGRRKGKYLPLALLVPHIGMVAVLRISPSLVVDMLEAMRDESVICCAAAQLLDVALKQLRQDLNDPLQAPLLPLGTPGQSADERWLGFWVGPMLAALTGDEAKIRTHVAVHALPIPLKQEGPRSLKALLQGLAASQVCDPQARAAALVVALKVARSVGLLNTLEATLMVGGEAFALPAALLHAAVMHTEDAVRLDALELCCVCPRKAQLPGPLEVAVLKWALPVCMRMTHVGSRNKLRSLVAKFLTRVNIGASRLQRDRFMQDKHGGERTGRVYEALQDTTEDLSAAEASLKLCEDFVHWLVRFLIASLYPGAAYQRKHVAVDLLQAVAEEWLVPKNAPPLPPSKGGKNKGGGKGGAEEGATWAGEERKNPIVPFGSMQMSAGCVQVWSPISQNEIKYLHALVFGAKGVLHF